MKATINTKTFRDAINKVNIMKVNRQLSVLAYALLSVKDRTARITVTDLEKAIEVQCQADGDEFSALLLRKTAQTFLYGQDGNTTVEANGKRLTLERNAGHMQTKPRPITDFPPIPAPTDDMPWATIDAKWLYKMLDILLTGCAKEESRPILTGIVFSDGAMVSADGFRLVEVKHKKAQFGLGDKQVIISYQTLALVKRLFGKESEISIGFHHPDKVYFKSDTVLLTSQTIQGTFPNWKQLIPKQFACHVSFSSPLMAQRLKMIDPEALIAGIVRLQFQRTLDHNEPECLLSGGSDDDARYSMRLPVKIETEQEAKIAFNYKFLCEAIKPFSVCNLELTSTASPGKFTGDIEGVTIVVMPMFMQ